MVVFGACEPESGSCIDLQCRDDAGEKRGLGGCELVLFFPVVCLGEVSSSPLWALVDLVHYNQTHGRYQFQHAGHRLADQDKANYRSRDGQPEHWPVT